MLGRFVVLVDGTIGVGKTTLGGQLALRFGGTFLDGDDFKGAGRPWFCSSLTTCRSIRAASVKALETDPIVFVGRPVRCMDWLYFKGQFERMGTRVILVGLQASFESLTAEARGRTFSKRERDRMAEMIQQGYGARPYSDIHVHTDQEGIERTVDRLEARLRAILDVRL